MEKARVSSMVSKVQSNDEDSWRRPIQSIERLTELVVAITSLLMSVYRHPFPAMFVCFSWTKSLRDLYKRNNQRPGERKFNIWNLQNVNSGVKYVIQRLLTGYGKIYLPSVFKQASSFCCTGKRPLAGIFGYIQHINNSTSNSFAVRRFLYRSNHSLYLNK